MAEKVSRFDMDWWVVQKRFIYIAVSLLVVTLLAGAGGLYVWVYGNPFRGADVAGGGPAGARFVSLEGGVKVVRADTREMISARADTNLLPGDIVQTEGDGRARITLADGSTLFVKPDSVVQIAENAAGEDGARTKVRVAVESGQVNVRTEQQPEGASNIVRTQLTENRLTAQTDASFHVREDKSEAIRVSTGAVESISRAGDVATLRGGEYAAVTPQGSLTQKEKLLAAPAPLAPRNLERVEARGNQPVRVALRWQRPSSGAFTHYRVEVATSPFFVPAGKLIERDQLQSTEFTVDDLRHGNYFWRVLAVAPSGQTSDWSEPQKFVVVSEGGTGEAVSVSNVVIEYVAGQIYLVRGQTQPGNTLRCAGRETLAARDGHFQLQINAPRNQGEVAIEAADSRGNKRVFRFPLAPGRY
jgi:hypothetical protein